MKLISLFALVFDLLLIGEIAFSDVGNRVRIKKSSELIVDDTESEELTAEKALLLTQKRHALIQDIRRFLQEANSKNQKAELGLRLASLYLEDYHAALSSLDKANGEASAKASLTKAINIYQQLLKAHPSHPRKDEMLYFLALATSDRQDSQTAISYFSRLSTLPGNSRFKASAQIHLGDYYFDKNRYDKASEFYDRVIRAKNPKLLSYAIYKKAWCLYNQQNHDASIKHFLWVARSPDKDTVRVRNEAVRDIALPFSELRLVADGLKFFESQEPVASRQGLELFASLLKEKGAYEEAMRVYNRLLEVSPNFKRNPEYEIAIVDSMRLLNRNQDAIDRLFSRLALYSNNSNWYELNSADPATIREWNTRFEETARRYALESHAQGQRTRNEKLYEAARSLYEKYLEYFPLSSEASKIRFYLAEILFKQNRFLEAATHYYRVYKSSPNPTLRIDGLRYALSSLDRLVNDDRKQRGLPQTDSTRKLSAELVSLLPYSEIEERFLSYGDEYARVFPGQKDIPTVLYEQSYLRYMHYDFEKARSGFWTLIQRFPKDSASIHAAFLVLDILNRRQDYDGLISVCKSFLGHRDFGKSVHRTQVAGVLRQAELRKITLLEEKGQHKEAGSHYLEYARVYGTQDESLFEKALYNASINFTKAELFSHTVETQERFLRRFPKSALRENMLLSVARTHEMLGNLDKAALYFEEFSHAFSGHEQAKTALRLAGIYYWGSSHPRQAEVALEEYRKRYPQDSRLVAQDLLDLYESQGLTQKQIRFYLEERARKGISAADYLTYSLKIADLEMQSKNRISPSLQKEIDRAGSVYRKDLVKSPKGTEALSRVSFQKGTDLDGQFHRFRISGRKTEQRLKRKIELLKQLDATYGDIAKLGSPNWGLASLYRAAFAYQQMALEISQAPVPGELNAAELDIYRAELQKELIAPFNERARVLSKTCLEKSMENNWMSAWVARCYALSSQLDGKVYAPVRTQFLPSVFTGLLLPTGSKTPIGSVKRFSYPYYSSFLFNPVSFEKSSRLPDVIESQVASDGQLLIPTVTDYRTLSDERRAILTRLYNDEQGVSFAGLNLLRLLSPQKALSPIAKAISTDPMNVALHNLLALAHLDQNHLTQAKVTWLSLIARGEKSAVVLGNLGVVAMLEGKEQLAQEYWNEAVTMGDSREASINLGFLALRYRNGFEAKKHFERALATDDKDAAVQVGHAVALLQNIELEEAKPKLSELYRRFKSDPYARITTSYYLIDIEGKPELAERVLADYVEGQNETPEIRRVLSETKRSISSTAAGLPTIEP